MSKKGGIQGLSSGRSDVFRIDPRKLQIREGFNCRDFDLPDNIQHIEELAISIREVGVQEPLTVVMEGGVPYLTNGECRLRAVLKLLDEGVEILTVPVQTEPRYASEADHYASQLTRNSGRGFTVIEQARLFSKLMGFGWTEKLIAGRAGMTPDRVRQILSLNRATPAVLDAIGKGEIAATTVQRELAGSDPSEAEERILNAVQRAKAEGKTKAGPRHVPKAAPPAPKQAEPRVNWKELLFEVLGYMKFPDDEKGDQKGTFEIPEDRWSRINAATASAD